MRYWSKITDFKYISQSVWCSCWGWSYWNSPSA